MARILLVEDDKFNQDLICRYLELFAHEVQVASDGEECLGMVNSDGSFDVILMDIELPKIDGWEAARRLRANPRTKSIRIIAVTAHAMSGDRERTLESGCDSYVTKPINFDDLLNQIDWFCNSTVMRTQFLQPHAWNKPESQSESTTDDLASV